MRDEHIILRAYGLADTGLFKTVSELKRALRREGYLLLDFQHLQGRQISRDLGRRLRDARASPAGRAVADPAANAPDTNSR